MLWAYLKICLLIGFVVSVLSYQTWAYQRALDEPDRRVFGAATPGAILSGALVVLGEGLAWGVFIALTPLAYVGDYLALGRRGGQRRPVLLVHGYLHNRGAWIAHGVRLRLGGWTQVYSLNLWPPNAELDHFAQQVRDAVERICGETGSDTVDLVCHSMGGVVARAYVQRFEGRARVEHLVTLGSPHHGTGSAPLGPWDNSLAMSQGSPYVTALDEDPAGLQGVAVTTVCTVHDNIVIPASSAALPDPAEAHMLEGVGHVALLWSPRVWTLVRDALEQPAEPAQPESPDAA